MSTIYLDTSVLAKRYLPAPQSDAIEALLTTPGHLFLLSELCVVELESTLRRRAAERSGGSIDRRAVRRRMDDDLESGFFELHPLDPPILKAARRWIADGEPLATLDALHLSTALAAGAEIMATDDRQLARAARAAGLQVTTFI